MVSRLNSEQQIFRKQMFGNERLTCKRQELGVSHQKTGKFGSICFSDKTDDMEKVHPTKQPAAVCTSGEKRNAKMAAEDKPKAQQNRLTRQQRYQTQLGILTGTSH